MRVCLALANVTRVVIDEQILCTRSGRTAYEEASDSEWKGDLCIFGETILFREAESYTGARYEAEATNEHVLETELGVLLARDVRRLLVGQLRDKNLVNTKSPRRVDRAESSIMSRYLCQTRQNIPMTPVAPDKTDTPPTSY